jgi:chromosome segregation ATPase
MTLFLIIVALSLSCVAALQFSYMIFLHSVYRHDKRRIERLEGELRVAKAELEELTHELATANQELGEVRLEEPEEELWPEFIDV